MTAIDPARSRIEGRRPPLTTVAVGRTPRSIRGRALSTGRLLISSRVASYRSRCGRDPRQGPRGHMVVTEDAMHDKSGRRCRHGNERPRQAGQVLEAATVEDRQEEYSTHSFREVEASDMCRISRRCSTSTSRDRRGDSRGLYQFVRKLSGFNDPPSQRSCGESRRDGSSAVADACWTP